MKKAEYDKTQKQVKDLIIMEECISREFKINDDTKYEISPAAGILDINLLKSNEGDK